MKTRLNETLLNLIILVQNHYKYIISENRILNTGNVWNRQKEYYYNIDSNIFKNAGIDKNDINFDKIMSFRITESMRTTEYSDLQKFEF